jgi:hypothetical protein
MLFLTNYIKISIFVTFHESTQHQISTEIRPWGAALIHVDRRTEVTKPVGAFCVIGHGVCGWFHQWVCIIFILCYQAAANFYVEFWYSSMATQVVFCSVS